VNLDGPVVLPPDVQVMLVRSLPARIRRGLRSSLDGYAVTRPRGRSTSKIVDAAAADLLQEFRTPQRVVDAVVSYCRSRDLDPKRVLADAFPLLRDCFNARFLVAADTPQSARILPNFARGERLDGWTVLRSVQVLSDSEVYQARADDGRTGTLKVLRPGVTRAERRQLEREAQVLERLDGAGAPRLLGRGVVLGAPYLALSWCPGVSPLVIAAELRERQDATADRALLALAVAIGDAYVALHQAGVMHADIHPRNVLVDDTGAVSLLDFGLSRFTDGSDRARGIPRGSIPSLRDPGYAAAILAGRPPRRAAAASEQYGLAALLYFLFTGDDYLDFALAEREALAQIVQAPPLPFTARGHASWPDVEAALSRALAKTPAARFRSVADFVAALRRAAPRPAARAADRAVAALPSPITELTTQLLRDLRLDAPAYAQRALPAPTASVAFGAAGIAWALYRIACLRDDASLLSLADAWLTRAERQADQPTAFANAESGLHAAEVGRVTPYHCVSGLHVVRALVGRASGDAVSAVAAARAFVAASTASSSDKPDLFTGRAGTLVGAATIFEALPDRGESAATALRNFGDAALESLWTELDAHPPVADCPALPALGIAHGWAGLVWAALRWHRAAGAALPASLPRRMAELAALAEPAGRGVRWRVRLDEADSAPGVGYQTSWCNGSAGFVHLWTLAARVLGDASYLQLAKRSAWNAWESSGAAAHICCGPAGRAYALLAFHQATGAGEWLDRARRLADRAAVAWSEESIRPYPLSLYKGATGIAVLGADLARPESACMPFFGEEGWPAPGGGVHD